MKKSQRRIDIAILAFLLLFAMGRSLQAAPLRAALRATSIAVGEKAVITGQSVAGARITVQITGPASIPPGNATADAAGNFSLEFGPFSAPGSYGIYVRAGIEQQMLVLEVQERLAAAGLREAANGYIQAVRRVTNTMESELDRLSGLVRQFPPGDPDIASVARELPRLRTLFAEVHRVSDQIVGLTEPLVFDLCEVQGLRPGVCTPVGSFFSDWTSILNPAGDALEAEGRSEITNNSSDQCLKIAYIKKGFSALATIVKIVVGGFRAFIVETLAAERGAGALGWFQERFMERLPNALRPLTETQEFNVHLAHTGIEAVMPYVLHGEHAHPWATIVSLIQGGVTIGFDHYLEHHCQTFRGRISGHVHVEALENGVAFYGQDNDWTGQVTLAGAKTELDAPVPLAGSIIGRAKNFKANNWLHTLYPKDISQKAFLTTPPSEMGQAFALFYAKLEGTIHNGVLTIRYDSTPFDGVQGMVKVRMTAIVVPSASPVPIVRNFDLPYQNAAFQLSRCFGKEGVSFPITMEYEGNDTLRRVKGTFSRDLAKGGARGTFMIKVDLCSGCPATWEGQE